MERKLKYLWIGNDQEKSRIFSFAFDNPITDQTTHELSEILNKETFSNDLKVINFNTDTWCCKTSQTFLFIILADENSELSSITKTVKKLERLFYAHQSDLDIFNQNWINDLWKLNKCETPIKSKTIDAVELINCDLLLIEMDERLNYENINNVEMMEYNYLDQIDSLRYDTEFYRKSAYLSENNYWKEWIPIAAGVVVFVAVLGLMLAFAASFDPETSRGL